MIRSIFLIILLFVPLSGLTQEQEQEQEQEDSSGPYSCRDSQGQLHVVDNLLALPEECLGKYQKYKSWKINKLQVVPAKSMTPEAEIIIEQNIRDAEREERLKELQEQQLHERAGALVELYQSAVAEKRKAQRSWRYGSRETIKQANEKVANSREGKRQLLGELDKMKISVAVEKQIRATLEKVEAP